MVSVAAIPLARHPEQATIRERIVNRGRLFEALKGYHFKAYDGLGLRETGPCVARYNIQSRIIIDTAGASLPSLSDIA